MELLRKNEENLIVECELWKQHCITVEQQLRISISEKIGLLADITDLRNKQENLNLQNADFLLQKYSLEKEVDQLRSFTLECKDNFEDYRDRSSSYVDKLIDLRYLFEAKLQRMSDTSGYSKISIIKYMSLTIFFITRY